MRTRVLVSAAALAALLAVPAAGPGFAQEGAFDLPGESTEAPEIDGLELIDVVSADHLEGTIDYDVLPPAGGPHNPVWQNCGFYEEMVITEQAVHSQEHGAVWVTYRPDLADADRDRLRDLTEDEPYLLVSPWPDQEEPVVASAWGAQLRLDGVDDPRLEEFIAFYADNPDGPEPGAPCDGASDETRPLPAATPAAATPNP